MFKTQQEIWKHLSDGGTVYLSNTKGDKMTREKAKQIVIDAEYKVPDLFNLVDTIYNDFESRTCENCKHSEYFELSECPIDTEVRKRLNKKNFGCNLFVSTDTKS